MGLDGSICGDPPANRRVSEDPLLVHGTGGFGFVALWAERHLKEPNLIARYANFRAIPDLHTTTMQVLFNSQSKAPGWDEARFDWDWFIEVQFANASETPCTIDGLKAEISLGTWKDKQIFRAEYLEDLDEFDIDMSLDGKGNGHGQRCRRALPADSKPNG